MSSRIRGLCAVLAAGLAALYAMRRQQRLERELTAERAGHRLIDRVVYCDFERRLSEVAAAAGVSAEPLSSTSRSNPQEGGQ